MPINKYKQGATFDGRSYTFPFEITGAKFLIQFKTAPAGRAIFEYSNEEFLLINEAEKKIILLPRLMNFPVGSYHYDIRVEFLGGRIKTYAADVLLILQNVSR